ncbi:hypothetical protein LCGC14_2252870, partial [marine sediment metagenome]
MSGEVVRVAVGEVVDPEAIYIGELYEKARTSIADSVGYQIECGMRLAEKKASMKHGEWLPWLDDNAGVLGFATRQTASRLIKLTKSNGTLTHHLNEAEAVQISRQTWGNAPANYSSETNEWYTPPEFLEYARQVLREIDLDPASSAKANKTVQAKEYFSSGGLDRDWHGRVFLNPPYGVEGGRSVAGLFCEKAITEFRAGRVSQAIILVNSLHSQNWQAPLYDFPICFVNHRIRFVNHTGEVNPNPTFQNIFVHLGNGESKQRFTEIFD